MNFFSIKTINYCIYNAKKHETKTWFQAYKKIILKKEITSSINTSESEKQLNIILQKLKDAFSLKELLIYKTSENKNKKFSEEDLKMLPTDLSKRIKIKKEESSYLCCIQ